jgi:hypothetical protein
VVPNLTRMCNVFSPHPAPAHDLNHSASLTCHVSHAIERAPCSLEEAAPVRAIDRPDRHHQQVGRDSGLCHPSANRYFPRRPARPVEEKDPLSLQTHAASHRRGHSCWSMHAYCAQAMQDISIAARNLLSSADEHDGS